MTQRNASRKASLPGPVGPVAPWTQERQGGFRRASPAFCSQGAWLSHEREGSQACEPEPLSARKRTARSCPEMWKADGETGPEPLGYRGADIRLPGKARDGPGAQLRSGVRLSTWFPAATAQPWTHGDAGMETSLSERRTLLNRSPGGKPFRSHRRLSNAIRAHPHSEMKVVLAPAGSCGLCQLPKGTRDTHRKVTSFYGRQEKDLLMAALVMGGSNNICNLTGSCHKSAVANEETEAREQLA
ncbi:uncharacterized protein LOC128628047 [Artibeus jamaicensis]|uniref:uncharacterized protein LOC128628047 n=1 Tax=Artibeus jamaicensis TaxID=9417 RepID=UPI00235B26DD|nr:uncharacterized protein LOC128628047 [Artibeus jamaicensis]